MTMSPGVMASPRISAGAIYGYGIGIDDKNPGNYSLNLTQAGLGMPERDYYLSDDPDLGEDARGLSQISCRHADARGTFRTPRRAPTALSRWRPRSPASTGPAPTAATPTRPTIP